MMSRANQLKKAREDFFFGKESSPGGLQQPENSPIISRPTNLPIRSEKGSNLQDSPTSDKVKVTYEPNFCRNHELSLLFTNRFSATRYMKVKRMGIHNRNFEKGLAIFGK